MTGIYKVTNKINNKIYIGQSFNINQRFNKHRNSPFNPNAQQYNCPFYKAIRKYGLENFTFEVIEECSIDFLNEREKYWIEYYNSSNPEKGYNLTTGGQNAVTSSKITRTQANEIIDLLLYSSISQEKIGQIYNISQREVSGINQGQCWIKEGLKYPLRTASEIQLRQKNKKVIINTCPICGNPMSKGAKKCQSCLIKEQRRNWPNREELKQLIRINSFVNIGKQFNVSDNAVRKWCKAYNLPYTKKEIKQYSNEEWKII